jgi:signal-transduction protein with cAMP-binding, CBS, and nucleotidyltransferase domain
MLQADITRYADTHIGKTRMIADERVLNALRRSTLIAELRDAEIRTLCGLLSIKHYQAGQSIAKPSGYSLDDALLVLVEGKIEVRAVIDGEPILMMLEHPGDLARVISFVGSNMLKIDANIDVQRDSTVLLLERAQLETLLGTVHHSIVYYVMRGLVRHMHGLARRKSAETGVMSNYFYRLNGLF